jgi:arginine deiminase
VDSIKELDDAILKLSQLRDEHKELHRISAAKKEEVDTLEQQIQAALEKNKLESFKGSVGTVYISERFSVRFPKDVEIKEQLEHYLKDRGAWSSLWSINANSLAAWYKEEMALAKAEGRYLDIPGLDPAMSKTLNFRKG